VPTKTEQETTLVDHITLKTSRIDFVYYCFMLFNQIHFAHYLSFCYKCLTVTGLFHACKELFSITQ
jgi:hypothetical protein